jgi:hypothetical protein
VLRPGQRVRVHVRHGGGSGSGDNADAPAYALWVNPQQSLADQHTPPLFIRCADDSYTPPTTSGKGSNAAAAKPVKGWQLPHVYGNSRGGAWSSYVCLSEPLALPGRHAFPTGTPLEQVRYTASVSTLPHSHLHAGASCAALHHARARYTSSCIVDTC